MTLDIPEVIESARQLIRPVHSGDAAEINAAIVESFASLKAWMPWAQTLPTLADTETFCREALADFSQRKSFGLELRLKAQDALVGMTGFHNIDWAVPKLEIGYWLRTRYAGQGYATEAVECLTTFAFTTFQANRVEIRMDDLNHRSWRVAERAGFRLEALLRNDQRTPSGLLRHTRIYAKIRRADGVIE